MGKVNIETRRYSAVDIVELVRLEFVNCFSGRGWKSMVEGGSRQCGRRGWYRVVGEYGKRRWKSMVKSGRSGW